MSTPCIECEGSGSGIIGSQTMRGEVRDGFPITDDHAFETPIPAQDIVQ